jgi:hypothetical protein
MKPGARSCIHIKLMGEAYKMISAPAHTVLADWVIPPVDGPTPPLQYRHLHAG